MRQRLVLLLLCFVGTALPLAEATDNMHSETQGAVPTTVFAPQPAEERILKQMWYVRANDDDSLELRPGLVTAPGALGKSIAESDPAHAYFERWAQLFWAHHELMGTREGCKADPAYIADFKAAEQKIFAQLPERPDAPTGNKIAYATLQSAGILQRILNQSGPAPTGIMVPPEMLEAEHQNNSDVWGIPGQSFILGEGFAATTDTRESALPFHCCDGRLVITAAGPVLEPYGRAHASLLNDASYRDLFIATRKPFAQRVTSLSTPLDTPGRRECRKITTEYRAALEAAGILDRIEERVRAHQPASHEVTREGGS